MTTRIKKLAINLFVSIFPLVGCAWIVTGITILRMAIADPLIGRKEVIGLSIVFIGGGLVMLVMFGCMAIQCWLER